MRTLELWLFAALTSYNLISAARMDVWLNRICKMKRIYTGKLYINQSLWDSKTATQPGMNCHAQIQTF